MVDKEAIRKAIKAKLSALSEDQKREKEKEIQRKLLELLRNITVSNSSPSQFFIGAYAPMSSEVNWLNNLPNEIQDRLAFPRSSADEEGAMKFYQACYEELELVKDFGVKLRVPKKDAKLCFPKIQIVPALGLGKDGTRLGKGKGYYDRYLATHQSLKIGLCFQEQLFETLPTDKHDQKMDYVITELELIAV